MFIEQANNFSQAVHRIDNLLSLGAAYHFLPAIVRAQELNATPFARLQLKIPTWLTSNPYPVLKMRLWLEDGKERLSVHLQGSFPCVSLRALPRGLGPGDRLPIRLWHLVSLAIIVNSCMLHWLLLVP
jgi:hypothetical protein